MLCDKFLTGFHWHFASCSVNVLSKYAPLSFTNTTWEKTASVFCVCLPIYLLNNKAV